MPTVALCGRSHWTGPFPLRGVDAPLGYLPGLVLGFAFEIGEIGDSDPISIFQTGQNG